MKVEFHGAVRSVTGSMHVLEAAGSRVLLECGLYQGKRKEAERRNRNLPVDPTKLAGCVLSHAHIDHSGNLPNLVRNGYAGRIHATSGTADLAKALLRDSAYLHERDIEYLNEKRAKQGEPPLEPMYTQADVEETTRRFEVVGYQERFEAAPGVRARFFDAGHILGSAVTVYELEEAGRTVRVGFTGDLGRPAQPILRDPAHIPAVDYLITESTYGNRLHEGVANMKERLREIIGQTAARGGRVVIPAFSVGRTQNIVYFLSELFHEGDLPRVPVFVDSPLAIDATKIYRDHPECYDQETKEAIARGESVFGFDLLRYTRSKDESMALNSFKEACVIVSASGMCEGGRVLHHLKHSVGDADNTILFVGFQAADTLGRRMLEGARTVRIYGKDHPLRARVEKMNGFSAHADRDELSAWIKNVPGLKAVFVVHGEEDASMALAAHLARMKIKAHVPMPGEAVEL